LVFLSVNLFNTAVTTIFTPEYTETVWRPGSARTCWGSSQRSPNPSFKRWGARERERRGWRGMERGREVLMKGVEENNEVVWIPLRTCNEGKWRGN